MKLEIFYLDPNPASCTENQCTEPRVLEIKGKTSKDFKIMTRILQKFKTFTKLSSTIKATYDYCLEI